jgi:hypothetical protein
VIAVSQRVKISKNNIGNTDRYHLLQPMCITKEIVTFKVDCDHQASGELVSHNAYPDILQIHAPCQL